MITPGTLIDASMLDEQRNNFLAGVYRDGEETGVCFADISTGEVFATVCAERQELLSELGRFLPREVLLGGGLITDHDLLSFITERLEGIYSPLPEHCSDDMIAAQLAAQFHIHDFCGSWLGRKRLPPALYQRAAAISGGNPKTSLPCLGKLEIYQQDEYMELDLNARRNLELCETMRNKEKRGSLLWVVDRTKPRWGPG